MISGYVVPSKFAELMGYDISVVESAIHSGALRADECRVSPDGDVLIDLALCRVAGVRRRLATQHVRLAQKDPPPNVNTACVGTHELLSLAQLSSAREPIVTVAGIYFLFKGDELVYVGQSANIMRRVYTHNQTDWDSFAYIVTPDLIQQQRELLENAYIAAFRPKYNRSPGCGALDHALPREQVA